MRFVPGTGLFHLELNSETKWCINVNKSDKEKSNIFRTLIHVCLLLTVVSNADTFDKC